MGSNNNKTKLQTYLKEFILQFGNSFWPNVELICSGTNEQFCESNLPRSACRLQYLQNKNIEEADSRIILHLDHAVKFDRYSHCFILSSDTDVLILALHFFHGFQKEGLKVFIIFKSNIVNYCNKYD